MNEHEIKGATRHLKGRAETVVGGVAGDLARQAGGTIDQIAGGAEYAYGKVRDAADDFVENAADFADDARQKGTRSLREARDLAGNVVERGQEVAGDTARAAVSYGRRAKRYVDQYPAETLAAVAATAFAIGWLAKPRR